METGGGPPALEGFLRAISSLCRYAKYKVRGEWVRLTNEDRIEHDLSAFILSWEPEKLLELTC